MNYVKAPINDFATLLIGAEGAKTPAGVRGRGDPTGAIAPRRLPGRPRTACAWSANQQASFKEPIHLRGLFQCPRSNPLVFLTGMKFPMVQNEKAWNHLSPMLFCLFILQTGFNFFFIYFQFLCNFIYTQLFSV